MSPKSPSLSKFLNDTHDLMTLMTCTSDCAKPTLSLCYSRDTRIA